MTRKTIELFGNDNRGQTKILTVIALAGIVLGGAALFGGQFFSFINEGVSSPPQGSIQEEVDGNAVTLTVTSLDNTDTLRLEGTGVSGESIDATVGDSVSVSGLGNGDTVNVVASNENTNQTIHTYEYEG